MLTNRSVATVIILTIVTCGIYGLYWLWVTCDALYKEAEGQGSTMQPIVTFLLCFFLADIGYLIFGMNVDADLNAIKAKRGIPTTDNKVLYMILGFIIPIVLIGMVQNEINQIA